jgi:hypothetical protein
MDIWIDSDLLDRLIVALLQQVFLQKSLARDYPGNSSVCLVLWNS